MSSCVWQARISTGACASSVVSRRAAWSCGGTSSGRWMPAACRRAHQASWNSSWSRCFRSGSLITRKCQGCRFDALGALPAACRMSRRSSSEMGSGFTRRMARCVKMASPRGNDSRSKSGMAPGYTVCRSDLCLASVAETTARWGLAHLFLEQPPAERMLRLPHYRWLVVATVCVGAFLGQLDASIATLVLPTLEEAFHADLASVEWVAIAYLLTLAALVVTFGRLADMTGRKLLYNAGFIVFILGSALCGLAPDLGLLIAFRVLQGVGAAMLQANSVAIIAAVVPRWERGRAIGVQGAAQAVGLSVGPSVGGLLIGTLGWQWVFFIAVPFGLLGTLLAWIILPQTVRAGEAPEREL